MELEGGEPQTQVWELLTDAHDCKELKFLFLGVGTAVVWAIAVHRGATPQSVSAAKAQTGAIVAATKAFLSSL